jgi:peptidoglycan/LPS O-acetylase OafA/YrhL
VRASLPEVEERPLGQRSPQARLTQFDGMRGFATLFVLVFHYLNSFPDVFETSIQPVPHLVLIGYSVYLFFILSGFVILMSVERSKRPSDFVINRVVRLYPTYWIALAISSTIVASGFFPDTRVTQHTLHARQFLLNVTMLQQYFRTKNIDGVFWTLTQELAFYFWAFVVLATGSLGKLEKLCAAFLVFRLALGLSQHFAVTHVGLRLCNLVMLENGHLFVIGMMFYRLRSRGSTWLRHALIAFGAAQEGVRGSWQIHVFIVLGIGLFYALHYGRAQWLNARPLLWLGSISYALYAVHEIPGWALLLFMRRHGVNYWLAMAITTACALGLSQLITNAEAPAMAWLKKELLRLRARFGERFVTPTTPPP